MSQQRTRSGSSICTGWKRRVSAGSFSMCWRYSAQVVAAMVRRVAARQRRLQQVGGVARAGLAAGADQRMRLVDEQDDRRAARPGLRRSPNAGAARTRPSSPAPACIRPMSSAHRRTPRSAGGHVARGEALGASPSTTAVLPTPASPVRIGLFCRRRIRTSMIWRISSSRPTIGSIVPVEAFAVRSCEKRSSAVVPRGPPSWPSPAAPAATSPEPSIGLRLPSSESFQIGAMLGRERVDIDLGEFGRSADEGAPGLGRLQRSEQDMAAADLGLAEEQRRVVPAAVEQVDDDVGNARHLRLVLAEAFARRG